MVIVVAVVVPNYFEPAPIGLKKVNEGTKGQWVYVSFKPLGWVAVGHQKLTRSSKL